MADCKSEYLTNIDKLLVLMVMYEIFLYILSQFVTDRMKTHDTNGDGLIDNGGFADQTYDAWTATGAR